MTDQADYFPRMVEEFFEIDKRLRKMCTFMTTVRYADLEPVAQSLLGEQKAAMQHYHQILRTRLEMTGKFDLGNYSTYDTIDYSAPPEPTGLVAEHLGEPVEVGGHDIGRDGPPSFSG